MAIGTRTGPPSDMTALPLGEASRRFCHARARMLPIPRVT